MLHRANQLGATGSRPGWRVQRDQLPLWMPVVFRTGAAVWFALPSQGAWTGWLVAMAALGLVPIAVGTVWALATPPPYLLVTGDEMHLAVRGDDGRLATLRPRADDYVRSVMSERFGDLGELDDLDTLGGAVCSDDVCHIDLTRCGRV